MSNVLSETFLRYDRVKAAKASFFIKDIEFVVRPAATKAYANSVTKPPKDRKDEDGYYEECVAKHLLVEVKNLLNDDKSPFESNETNHIKLVKDYVGIGNKILAFASDPGNFVESNKVDEELGNSESSPSGK